jgi:hypothetical protein
MNLLKHIRSRSKVQHQKQQHHPAAQVYGCPSRDGGLRYGQSPFPRGQAARLPAVVLQTIFAYVCPHVLDSSYAAAEESMVEDGCMLCDMRDLAYCAMVCRGWHNVAQSLL